MKADMEYGSIEREIHVDATPEVVYEVISTHEHLRQWWPDEAELEPAAGACGTIWFRDRATSEAHPVPLRVVEADPPRRFSFRWAHPEGAVATAANSFLVTFELVPSGAGTLLRFSETGFREAAVLQEQYGEHVAGWDHFLPRLVSCVDRLVSTP